MPNHMKPNSVSLPKWYFWPKASSLAENAANQMH